MPAFVLASAVTEYEPNIYVADMSDVGLTVRAIVEVFGGKYPPVLTTEIGNGNNLLLTDIQRTDDQDEEVVYIVYSQEYGPVRLKLYND